MTDQPTPGSTGDTGDAGQLEDTGAFRRSMFTGSDLLNIAFHPEGGGDDGGDDGGEGGDGDPDTKDKGDKETLTKAEAESIIQKRVAAERKKFGDYESLKEKASKFDELEEANRSELEKATARADAAEKEKADRESDLQKERVKNAVTIAASGMSFVNPGVAHKLVDSADLEFDDDGKPKKESVEKALKALVESDPYLAGKNKARGDGGGGPRGPASGGEMSMSDRIRELAGKNRISG